LLRAVTAAADVSILPGGILILGGNGGGGRICNGGRISILHGGILILGGNGGGGRICNGGRISILHGGILILGGNGGGGRICNGGRISILHGGILILGVHPGTRSERSSPQRRRWRRQEWLRLSQVLDENGKVVLVAILLLRPLSRRLWRH
jgi:hypothetical protein